jgi:uncharacterized protein YutE (UPF0331/DUF86 family)
MRASCRPLQISEGVEGRAAVRPAIPVHGSFLRLGDLRVLEPDFAGTIARAAGLRNRLVHDYEDLDPGKVFDALGEALRDVPIYLARVNDYVKPAPGKP